jgi:hypothetical protein
MPFFGVSLHEARCEWVKKADPVPGRKVCPKRASKGPTPLTAMSTKMPGKLKLDREKLGRYKL